jgi:hypothetical protein
LKIPEKWPRTASGHPHVIRQDDLALIASRGELRDQVIALIDCVNKWRAATAPKPAP